MRRLGVALTALASALLSLGCADDAEPEQVTWYRDVLPVAQKRCLACHTAGGVGPFSLDPDPADPASYEAIAGVARFIVAAVEGGHMPPWDPEPSCRPYQHERILSSEEVEVFRRWFDDGAPGGDPADAPPVPAPLTLERVDRTLEAGVSYVPAADNGIDVQCFVLDPALDAETDLIGVRVLPNTSRAHDALVYRLDRAAAEALDQADPAAGFDCFGAPEGATLVGSWVPGAPPVVYPEATGVRLGTSDALVLLVYYDLSTGDGEAHSPGLELMFADAPVERPLSVLTLASDEFLLPATSGQTTAMASEVAQIGGTIIGLSAQLGTRGRAAGLALNGSECLLDAPRYSFGWQELYFFGEGVPLGAGDELSLTCTWANSSSREIAPGPGATDERCAAQLIVAPD